LFSRPFRGSGPIHLSKYLTTYKVGDYVDIIGNGSIHKGMPHKYYHGRTGIVWNVSKRAVGVEMNKQVRNRIIRKRLHVRVEHVQKSRCREDFLNRIKKNEQLRAEGKKNHVKVVTKRTPALPAGGKFVTLNKTKIVTMVPLKYELLL
jgi:large subunit ribosomal protein L21e